MKAIKLFAFACMALIMASCGSNTKTKDLKVETSFAGDAEMASHYSELLEIADKPAVYSMEKISKDDSGKAFDEQKWTVEVSVKVKNDDFKDKDAAYIQANIAGLTLNILNGEGKEILGQKGYKIEGDNITKFCELLAKGKDAEGTIVFTHSTNNNSDCDKWFDDEAASAQLVAEKTALNGQAGGSSAPSRTDVSSTSGSDNEYEQPSGAGSYSGIDPYDAMAQGQEMANDAMEQGQRMAEEAMEQGRQMAGQAMSGAVDEVTLDEF